MNEADGAVGPATQRTAATGAADDQREIGGALSQHEVERKIAVGAAQLDGQLAQLRIPRRFARVHDGEEHLGPDVRGARPLAPLALRGHPRRPGRREIGEPGCRRARLGRGVERREGLRAQVAPARPLHGDDVVHLVVHRLRAIRHDVVLVLAVAQVDRLPCIGKTLIAGVQCSAKFDASTTLWSVGSSRWRRIAISISCSLKRGNARASPQSSTK